MESKIQLLHPEGKKAIRMDIEKYEMLKNILLKCLEPGDHLTHTQLLESVTENFKMSSKNFQGSVGWHMEWVKLDLEARKLIKRNGDQSPVQFSINTNN